MNITDIESRGLELHIDGVAYPVFAFDAQTVIDRSGATGQLASDIREMYAAINSIDQNAPGAHVALNALCGYLANGPARLPDAERYNSDPDYIRSLVEQIKERRGLSQRKTAETIGAGWTSLKDWMAGKAKIPYACQHALEELAGAP